MMVEGNMPVYLARWDWMLVLILTYTCILLGERYPHDMCQAKKNTEKQKIFSNLKEHKETTRRTITISEVV